MRNDAPGKAAVASGAHCDYISDSHLDEDAMHSTISPDAVLDFWFGAPQSPGYGTEREAWFARIPGSTATCARFGAGVDAALAGAFDGWRDPRPMLARVFLDQFAQRLPRHPRSFADALALALSAAPSRRVVSVPAGRALVPVHAIRARRVDGRAVRRSRCSRALPGHRRRFAALGDATRRVIRRSAASRIAARFSGASPRPRRRNS
jgi:hypothetical protein